MKKRVKGYTGDLVALLIAVIFLIPLVWLVVSAFESHATLSLRMTSLTFTNFTQLFHSKSMMQSFVNALYLAVGTMILTTIIAIMAAYPLSRFKLRFRKVFMYIMIFATGLPVVALMIPVYDFFVAYNLIDSIWWTIMFMTATALPFATWIMKGFIDSVPLELEESAWVEGAGTYGSFVRVVVPLILPGASVVGIYTFINAWGDFVVPFILLQPPNVPASVTIAQFFGQYSINYSGLSAFAILYTIPAIILYVISTKWLGGGFNLGGAVKG